MNTSKPANTSLDRAKQFLAAKASKLAMVVVPLAALALTAIPARAATSFAGTAGVGATCAASSLDGPGSASCNFSNAGTGGSDPTLNWLQMSGSGSTSGGSGGLLSFGTSGSETVTGTVNPGTIDVSWAFSLGGNANTTWTVLYGLEVGGVDDEFTRTGTGTGSITGTGSFVVPSGGTIQEFLLKLTVQDFSGDFTVTIPGGATLDLNSPATAPEPASVILTGGGVASLFLLRRRKKTA